jgi:Zn ribbon nucleic-acid-binding protein
MYSNGEGLGTPVRNSPRDEAWKNWGDGKNKVTKSKRFVRCICPKCRKTTDVYMMWSGRGVPRKYCADCKVVISTYDELAMSASCHSVSVPAKKRGRSVTEE